MLELGNQKLLIVAPHPDDEILGCGGLIHRIKEAGGQVYVLFMTVGNTRDYSATGLSTHQQRVAEAEQVAHLLSYDGFKFALEGDNWHLRLDQVPQLELISQIANGCSISLDYLKPTMVAIPQAVDYNQDHRAVAEAAIAATRPAPDNLKPLQRVVLGYYPVITADWAAVAPLNPNIFVELGDADLAAKAQALSLYDSQIRNSYHQRNPKALELIAAYWGFRAGVKAAEPFYNYRLVI